MLVKLLAVLSKNVELILFLSEIFVGQGFPLMIEKNMKIERLNLDGRKVEHDVLVISRLAQNFRMIARELKS